MITWVLLVDSSIGRFSGNTIMKIHMSFNECQYLYLIIDKKILDKFKAIKLRKEHFYLNVLPLDTFFLQILIYLVRIQILTSLLC